jgi:hypothetical protein
MRKLLFVVAMILGVGLVVVPAITAATAQPAGVGKCDDNGRCK